MALSQQNIVCSIPLRAKKTQIPAPPSAWKQMGSALPHFAQPAAPFWGKKGGRPGLLHFLSLSLARTESVLLRQSRAGKNEGRQPAAAAGLNLLFWLQSFVFYYVSASCVCVLRVWQRHGRVCMYELFLRPRRLHERARGCGWITPRFSPAAAAGRGG